MRSNILKILITAISAMLIAVTLLSCGSGEESSYNKDEYDIITSVDKLNCEKDGDKYTIVSFPGLGIEPVVFCKTAFVIGGLPISWDVLLIIIGTVLALLYAFFKFRKEKTPIADFVDISLWSLIGAIIFSRLYYVIASPVSFKGRFLDIFNLWEGGYAVYGALIGCLIAAAVVCKIKKLKLLKVYDVLAPSFMIAQLVGRWGDLFVGRSYGYEINEGSVFYWLRMGLYPHINEGISAAETRLAYVHPLFLYEFVWNLAGFAFITFFYMKKKKRNDGQIFYTYLAWYGFGRIFIEILRTDSLCIFGSVKISLLIGCLSFFAGIALLIYGRAQGKKKILEGEEYKSEYPLFGTKFARAQDAEKTNENINSKNEEDEKNEVD